VILTTSENIYLEDQEFVLSLYEQFRKIMLHTAKKYVSNDSIVEDLVQDALVKLIQKISTLRKLSNRALSTYIVFTVRNISINYLKRQQIANKHHSGKGIDDETGFENNNLTPSAEEIVLIDERKGEFHKEFAKLSEKDRDILMGKYLLGLTDKELAAQHGCKPESIRMILTRARRNALAAMKKEIFLL